MIAIVAAACGSASPVSLVPSEGLARQLPSSDAPITEVVAGLNDAGFDLLRAQDGSRNLVLSPTSIGHVLLMVRGAADDVTAGAINTVLHLPPDVDADKGWNAIDAAMSQSANGERWVSMAIADRIWPSTDVQPDQGWIDLLTAQHGVTIETRDFAKDHDGSRDAINQWISDETEGLIPELLPEDSITPETELILTNAMYFEAQWEHVFEREEAGVFTRLDGATVDIGFMHEADLGSPRGSGDGFVAAEIPYIGNDFSMLIVVPEVGRFEEIRAGLDQTMLDDIDNTLTTGPFELFLPKWTTASQLDLFTWLAETGVAPGRYPGITDDAEMSAALHAADIAVDEWGTVAASATAIVTLDAPSPEPEIIVAADRPFLYLIRHNETGLVLFAGQVTDPTR